MPLPDKSDPKGCSAWIITDGRAGMQTHCIGIAEKLGLVYDLKEIELRGFWKFLAPWGPAPFSDKLGHASGQFPKPWPDFAIASGRRAVPYIRSIRKLSEGKTFTIILQDPRSGAGSADLIWVPVHDRLRGHNVVTTLTAPHKFSPDYLAELRKSVPASIDALPHPRVAVIIGGQSASHNYDASTGRRLAGALKSIGGLGASLMITTSRRTPPAVIEEVKRETAGFPGIFFDGTGKNPYGDFLAHADTLVVTGDSVNMTGEACATGRPVYVFHPEGGSKKFDRFHQALEKAGITRRLPDNPDVLTEWTYEPVDAAAIIAEKIIEFWRKHQK